MRNFAFIAALCIAFCCAHVASAQTSAGGSQSSTSSSTTSQTSQFFPPIGIPGTTPPCSASNPLIAWNGSGNTYCTTLTPTCPAGQFVTSYDGFTLICATPPPPSCPSGQTADNNGTCCAASSIVGGVCGGSPPSSCPSGQTADSNGTCCAASSMVSGLCPSTTSTPTPTPSTPTPPQLIACDDSSNVPGGGANQLDTQAYAFHYAGLSGGEYSYSATVGAPYDSTWVVYYNATTDNLVGGTDNALVGADNDGNEYTGLLCPASLSGAGVGADGLPLDGGPPPVVTAVHPM